jgi:hypothetical protein
MGGSGVICPELSESEARATLRGLEFVRVYLEHHEVELAGAPLADLAAAQARIAVAVDHREPVGFEAMGVPEFEQGRWDPRTAGPQLIGGD